MSNKFMNKNPHFVSLIGQALHGLACGLSLALALAVLVAALHAITLRVWTVANIQSWCGQTGACTEIPEHFGKTNLKVYADKAVEAQEAVKRFVRSPMSSLLASPAPTVTVVLRVVNSQPATSNGRPVKGKNPR